MKKLIVFISLSLVMMLSVSLTSHAQTYSRIKQGQAGDTLKQSMTYNHVLNVNANDLQSLSAHIMIDSVSGTPSGTATLYRSLDGVNWQSTGISENWATGVDTTFILTDTTFYGTFAKVAIVTTSTAQKSKYFLTVKSWNRK